MTLSPIAKRIAWLAFPEPDFSEQMRRRELFLAMSWAEIIHRPGIAGLTPETKSASVVSARASVRLPGPREMVSASARSGVPPTDTWINRVNILATLVSGLASAAIGFFQSAQFQSLLRTAFKTGGLWLYMHTPGLPHDPGSVAATEFVSQVVGAGMFGYGIILSAVAHSGNGSAATGTAAGPNAVPKTAGE